MQEETVKAKIPFLDLKRQYKGIQDEIFTRFQEVCENTAFSDGPFVKQFEQNFASYCETNEAVGVNSGTSALHLAMRVLDIGRGDEVIIPANTFIATAWAPSYVNATPVFVDCHSQTWNIDPAAIEEKITPRTKAIIGVHLYGQPFDVDEVRKIADQHNLFLVEDAAQAQGATYKAQRVGGLSEVACFSFYPGKNLGAFGEGGALTTNSDAYAERLRKLRNHGSNEKYYYEELGFNMRMGGLEGASLDVKLQYLDQWNARRKEIARQYQQGITNEKIQLQARPDYADSVYHLFVITTEDRDDLMNYLKERNIFAGLHYPVPCHLQEVYSDLGYKKGDFPHSEYLSDHCLSLPMFPELTDEEVERVIEAINNY